MIDGCWALDSDYTTYDRETGARTDYSEWEICFQGDGPGRERMTGRHQSGQTITCAGALSRSFSRDGKLVIEEPGNLQCSNGSYIFRRVITCTVDEAGRADCNTAQPERGTNSDVRLRRKESTP